MKTEPELIIEKKAMEELCEAKKLPDAEFVAEIRRIEEKYPDCHGYSNWDVKAEVDRRLLLRAPQYLAKPIVFVAGKAAFDPETLSQLMRGGYCVLRCKQEDVEFIKELKEMAKSPRGPTNSGNWLGVDMAIEKS